MPAMLHLMTLLQRAALVLCMSGCSFFFAEGPRGSGSKQTCTDTYGLPIMDLLFAGAVGGAAIGVSASADQSALSGLVNLEAAIIGVVALTEGVSALYGYSKVSSCRDAIAAAGSAR